MGRINTVHGTLAGKPAGSMCPDGGRIAAVRCGLGRSGCGGV